MDSIRESKDFQEVRNLGKRSRKQCLALSYLNKGSELSIGMAVPRKVGKAHVRNKIRRRVREIFRSCEDAIGSGMYVISVYPGAHLLSYDDLKEMLEDLIEIVKKKAMA